MRSDEISLRFDPPSWFLDRPRDAADEADRCADAEGCREDASEPVARPLTVDDHALHGWV